MIQKFLKTEIENHVCMNDFKHTIKRLKLFYSILEK